jgi:flavin reductase (DIM6/NTAB) family NADH-FMN oxidoreductase RutF
VVGEGQRRLLAHFASGFEPGEAAFAGLAIGRSPRGLPVLTETVGFLECRASAHVESGDHRVFLAEVLAGRLDGDKRPMVHVRRNGMRY